EMAFVLLLVTASVLWISRLLPDYAVGLGLIASWVLLGLAQPTQAALGFASLDWLFVVAILGFAAAISRSGLLFRAGGCGLQHLPGGLVPQAGILMLMGIVLGPILPSNNGRAALTAPLALAIVEASRLRDREPGAAVLGLAAWIGSSPLSFMFLNGASLCL